MTVSRSQIWATQLVRRLSHQPAFRIYGKATYEESWQTIDVFATDRRNRDSRWPLWRGHCTTLTADIICVGWDFAAEVAAEASVTRETPKQAISVLGGRLRDSQRRQSAGGPAWFSALELLAHECGHTGQARRMGWVYWPIGAALTLFREGPHWWNWFENQASETGQFGGIVAGTLHRRLTKL